MSFRIVTCFILLTISLNIFSQENAPYLRGKVKISIKEGTLDGYSDSMLKSKNQKKALVRFPGTNTWYVKDKIIDIKYTNRLKEDYIPVQDTKDEAEIIGKTYNIFGWDCEWKMGKPRTDAIIREKINQKN